jgi:hypothetical protein
MAHNLLNFTSKKQDKSSIPQIVVVVANPSP